MARKAFDPSLMETIVSKEAFVDEKTVVSVLVNAYNGGELKVQLSREYIRRDGVRTFRKLGRLTLVEAAAVAEAMPKVLLEVANAE